MTVFEAMILNVIFFLYGVTRILFFHVRPYLFIAAAIILLREIVDFMSESK